MEKNKPVIIVKNIHITINVTTAKGIIGFLKSIIPKQKEKG